MTPPITDTAHGSMSVHHHGEGADPLVCLHGFTLHGGMFAEFASHAGPVAAPDLPGHGGTAVAPITLDSTVAALAEWMTGLGGPRHLLGYSQGGRIALHLAVLHPELVSGVVVVSASLGLTDRERERRRIADLRQADHIERIGLDAFLDEWLANPAVAVRADRTGADRALRAENTAAGLAEALRGLGQGAVPKVDPERLAAPSLWIAGETDHRYLRLVSEGARVTGGRVAVVNGAGHNVVADAPDRLAALVTAFRCETRSTPD